MFEVIASDGLRVQKVQLTKSQVSNLVASSLWRGVVASCEIENINTDGIEMPQDLKLPDQLLKT